MNRRPSEPADMPVDRPVVLSLEDVVTALYCALADALRKAGIALQNGKLVRRRGPAPEIDDLQILCLAVLQELLGFESDNAFHDWTEANPVIRSLFPRRLTRQNFADRRVLLVPVLERLLPAFCDIAGQARPPFSSSTRTPSRPAAPCMPTGTARKGSAGSRSGAIAPPTSVTSTG
jgi:hypothetical protein